MDSKLNENVNNKKFGNYLIVKNESQKLIFKFKILF